MSTSRSLQCVACHQRRGVASDPDTPQFEHESYSDRRLMDVFTNGRMPEGYKLSSPFLRSTGLDTARCHFNLHHSVCVPHEVALGLVFRLRSFPP